MQGSAKKSLFALATVPFLMVLGNSLLIPVLPQLREALDASLFQVGLLITVFSLPAGLTIPVTGFLSDRFGRKVVMVPALLLYGLGGLVAGTAGWLAGDPYLLILLGRVIQGIGAGGTYQLAMALTGDIFTSAERAKALGGLEAANGLGKVVSPVAGAAAGLIAWFAPFFVYGVLALPVAALVWFVVREPEHEGKRRSLGEYLPALSRVLAQKGRSLGLAFGAGMIALLLLFGVLSFLSDQLAARYRILGFQRGLLIAIPVLVMAVTSFVVGLLAQRRGSQELKLSVSVGLLLIAIATVLYPSTGTPFTSIADTALLGLGTGLILSPLNLLITSAVRSAQRGVITAFYGTVRFLGVAVGPPAFGFAGSLGETLFFAAAGGVAGGLALAVWLAMDERRLIREAPATAEGPG